jgi:hypothetical protein
MSLDHITAAGLKYLNSFAARKAELFPLAAIRQRLNSFVARTPALFSPNSPSSGPVGDIGGRACAALLRWTQFLGTFLGTEPAVESDRFFLLGEWFVPTHLCLSRSDSIQSEPADAVRACV